MIRLEEYQQNFAPHPVPEPLVTLLEFDNEAGDFYSDGFELTVDGKEGFVTYSERPEFLDCLFAIGQANASGSTYAIWCRNGAIERAPIVIFGDEGGVHVVADDLLQLFRLLTFDAEPMVDWDAVTFYKDQDSSASPRAASYAIWLKAGFGIEAVRGSQEVEAVISRAQRNHGESLKAWMAQYYAG